MRRYAPLALPLVAFAGVVWSVLASVPELCPYLTERGGQLVCEGKFRLFLWWWGDTLSLAALVLTLVAVGVAVRSGRRAAWAAAAAAALAALLPIVAGAPHVEVQTLR